MHCSTRVLCATYKWVSKMALKPSLKTALLAGLFGLYGLQNIAVAQAVTPPNNPALAKSWQQLSPAQQAALKPMQTDWAVLDESRKKKWLAVAQRYQTMSPADQARMHSRMAEWAKLSPEQRSAARDNYSAVLSSPSSSGDSAGKSNLNEQWVKYQALSPEKKASLTEQAKKGADTVKTKPLSTP
jgi:Protein of unknown function (DUF3106)